MYRPPQLSTPPNQFLPDALKFGPGIEILQPGARDG
jgi:hypothetical protein